MQKWKKEILALQKERLVHTVCICILVPHGACSMMLDAHPLPIHPLGARGYMVDHTGPYQLHGCNQPGNEYQLEGVLLSVGLYNPTLQTKWPGASV